MTFLKKFLDIKNGRLFVNYWLIAIWKIKKEILIIMFWLGIIIGLVLGANISLFLYAIIFLGKKSEDMENDR